MRKQMIQYWEAEMLREESDRQTFYEYQRQSSASHNKPLRVGEKMALVRDRIVNLPRPERLAIYLHFWEEMPVFDIAKTMDIPKKTASKLIYRGLEQLKTELKALGDSQNFQNKEAELAA